MVTSTSKKKPISMKAKPLLKHQQIHHEFLVYETYKKRPVAVWQKSKDGKIWQKKVKMGKIF